MVFFCIVACRALQDGWQPHSFIPAKPEKLALPMWVIGVVLIGVVLRLFFLPLLVFSDQALRGLIRSFVGPMATVVGPIRPHHVNWERVSFNLHRPLGIIDLDSALLDGRLDLLPEDFAFVGMMGICVVPFAISPLLNFFSRWKCMTYWQLDLLFLQE
jgi:hypothetical protein